MPSVYQTVFGGNPVAPAIPTYLALSFSVNTVLSWPLESNIASPAVAEWIDCTATAPALTLQLSDARQVSTGYTAIFNNVGANTFSVLDAAGNTLMAPASGAGWILVLADNSTLAGTWRALQLGAGTSVANAAALAGNGLKAITTTLNERIFINAQGSNYTILTTDRAACVEWTGGAGGTFTSPNPVTAGSDWFCYIKNSGTGVLTFTPSAGTVDSTANKTFNPGDSCIVVCDGANFFTMGFGQSVASSFNFVTISLAGVSGNFVLNGAQLNRISYKFTGALAGNTVVVVPASIQQYWIDNETTGAFTLTISAGGAGTTFTIPQANRTILYCDGLNIVNAISSGSIQFADGTAAAPSITFASDLTMGFYKAGADVLGFSTLGVQRGTINSAGAWVINAPSSGTSLDVTTTSSTGIAVHANAAAGTFGLNITGAAAAARDLLLVGETGFSNGFTVQYDGTQMKYGFLNGNVTIGAPSSGAAATINAVSGAFALQSQGSGSSLNAVFNGGNVATGNLESSDSGRTNKYTFGRDNASTGNWVLAFNGTELQHVTSAGNVTVNAPSSGVALTIGGVDNGTAILVNDASAVNGVAGLTIENSGTVRGQIGTGPAIQTGAALGDFSIVANTGTLRLGNGSATALSIVNAGNVLVNSPSSGTAVTINGIAGSNQFATSDGTIGGFWGTIAATKLIVGISTNHGVSLYTNNSERIAISNTGVVTLPAAVQPAFYATENAGQALNAAATTTLIFNTAQFNQGANYATGTGIFTAPVAGLYLFTCMCWIQNNTAGAATISMWFSVNSGAAGTNQILPIGYTINAASQQTIYPGSVILKLAANDTVRINATVATNNLVHGSPGSNQSSFCGYLLG